MIPVHNVQHRVSILADDVTNTSVNGDGVDVSRFSFAQAVLAIEATTGNLSVIKVQESDDDSTYTDVTGLSFAALGATDDNKQVVALIDLRGKKKYLRWTITEDNTGTVDAVSGTFILGGSAEGLIAAADFDAAELLSA